MPSFCDNFWDEGGFEELKKLMAKGNESSESIASILHDKAELSKDYAKGLQKLAGKAEATGKEFIGTTRDAWNTVKESMENEAKWHLATAQKVLDEVSTPLKAFYKEQKKARKPIETKVDKMSSELHEARSQESKLKKTAFSRVKELDVCHDLLEDGKSGKGKVYSDKDIAKLEKNVSKAEESASKADKEYRAAIKKLEATRKKWETVMLEGCSEMEQLEIERVSHLRSILTQYVDLLSQQPEDHATSCEKLRSQVSAINENSDLSSSAELKGTGPNHPKEVLYDCYEEDIKLPMKADRRERRLNERIAELEDDLQREEKTYNGVKGLADVYKNQPNFSDDKNKADVFQQLKDGERAVASAQATLFKVTCSLADVTNRARPTHPFAQYIERSRDSHAYVLSTFNPPSSLDLPKGASSSSSTPKSSSKTINASSTSSVPVAHTTPSVSQEDHVDEFSSDFGDGNESLYRAVYDYAASKDDELTIQEGDSITVLERYEGGWWKGTCNGQTGLFPENYVEKA